MHIPPAAEDEIKIRPMQKLGESVASFYEGVPCVEGLSACSLYKKKQKLAFRQLVQCLIKVVNGTTKHYLDRKCEKVLDSYFEASGQYFKTNRHFVRTITDKNSQ